MFGTLSSKMLVQQWLNNVLSSMTGCEICIERQDCFKIKNKKKKEKQEYLEFTGIDDVFTQENARNTVRQPGMESFAHHSFSDTLCVTHTNTHEQAIGTEKGPRKCQNAGIDSNLEQSPQTVLYTCGAQGQVAELWWMFRTQTLHVRNYTEVTIFRVYAPGH